VAAHLGSLGAIVARACAIDIIFYRKIRHLSTTPVHLAKRDICLTASASLHLVRSIYGPWKWGDFGTAEWTDLTIEFVIVGGPGHNALGGLRSPRGRVEERERRTDVRSRVPPD
jgi:hypothetical protein